MNMAENIYLLDILLLKGDKYEANIYGLSI